MTVAIALILVTACQSTPDKDEQTTAATPVVAANVEKEVPVKKDPPTAIDSYVLYLLLTGETALQRHKYDVALEAYIEAAKRVKDPRVAEKATQIGQYLDNLPKTQKAVSILLDKDDKNVSARQMALLLAIKNKNQVELVKHLDAVLKTNPAAFEATLLGLEKALKSEADVKFIDQALEILAKQHPKQAMIFLTQSLLAVRQNNIEQARQKVHQALVLQPAWEKAQNFEAELQIYSGKLAFKKKQFAEAIAWFDKVKQGDLVFDAGTAAVSVLIEQQKFPEAEQRLGALLVKEQDPKQKLQLFVLQAELQSIQKKYSHAIDILTNALKDNPDNRDLLYARALTAEKMDNFVPMEKDLKKILEQDSDDVPALNALGYSLTEHTTRYEDAEKYLQQAIKLQPEEPMIVDSYGWLQFKKGNFVEALKYLQAAQKKMPENEITAHLAETLWALGRKQEAESLIKEALKKTPTDEILLEFQQRVLKIQPSELK
jgi:tetratricopeptide (TPR) repeat protein